VTKTLGFYSDLQSLESEDAITWSVFGPVAYAPPHLRSSFAAGLLKLIGVPSGPVSMANVWLWRRLPHPERRRGHTKQKGAKHSLSVVGTNPCSAFVNCDRIDAAGDHVGHRHLDGIADAGESQDTWGAFPRARKAGPTCLPEMARTPRRSRR
jgi:hypothetical protein